MQSIQFWRDLPVWQIGYKSKKKKKEQVLPLK